MTILLHGFWGQPRDWNKVLSALPLTEAVMAPDLYAPGELSPVHNFKTWTENFWKWVNTVHGDSPVQLVGYSMGARLAISAAVARPERVGRALFLSGNPILDPAEFAAREKWEGEWLAKFLSLSWEELEATWENQGVFSSASQHLERRKTPEMRELLGLSQLGWSPRLHPFTAADVRSLPRRMEWAFGALDQKYLNIAKSLQELPVQGQINIVPGAGHRLIVEASEWISAWIARKS